MPEVFISYGSVDRERVLEIIEQLQILGIDLWFDRYQIPGGVSWGGEIARGIKDCRLFMLMASNRSLESENVRNEIGLAAHYRKRFLPVWIEESVEYPEELLLTLQRIQYISAVRDFAAWKHKLLEALSVANIMLPDTVPAAGAPGGRSGPTIKIGTSLLHLLANRRPQERRFLDELRSHVMNRPHRPVFFFINGEQSQSVDAFISRLKLYTIPRYLSNLNLGGHVEWKHIPWPDPGSNSRADITQRMNDYHVDVRLELDLDSSSPSTDIVRRITDCRNPVVFYSIADGEKWRPALRELLSKLIVFWSELPDVPTTYPVILLVAVRSQQRTGLSNWFARRREPIQSMLSSIVASLQNDNLRVVLLPELGNVSLADAEDWVRSVVESMDPDSIIRQLRELFRQHDLTPEQMIPMERLLPLLQSILLPANTLRGS